MSRRDPGLPLRHMLDHAREALAMVTNRSRVDLECDRQFSLALTRLLEIIGEAANRVPKEEQSRRPGIAWPDIISLRNRLIHGYDSVDFDILWQIATQDLPVLIQGLEGILAGGNS